MDGLILVLFGLLALGLFVYAYRATGTDEENQEELDGIVADEIARRHREDRPEDH